MMSLAEWNTTPSRGRAPVSVLDRIFAILDAVKESDGSITITDIAARTALPKSTVSRLVTELTGQRYLERTEEGVALGLRLFELGARASLPRRLVAAAAPVLRNLRDATGERVGLWVQQGTDMVSIAAVAGRLPMLPTRAGMRSPGADDRQRQGLPGVLRRRRRRRQDQRAARRRRCRPLPGRTRPRARCRGGPRHRGVVPRHPRGREPRALRRPRRDRSDLDRRSERRDGPGAGLAAGARRRQHGHPSTGGGVERDAHRELDRFGQRAGSRDRGLRRLRRRRSRARRLGAGPAGESSQVDGVADRRRPRGPAIPRPRTASCSISASVSSNSDRRCRSRACSASSRSR